MGDKVRPRPDAEGYTLLDVCVGMAIFAVMLFISVPRIAELRRIRLLKGETKEIQRLLEDLVVMASQREQELKLLAYPENVEIHQSLPPRLVLNHQLRAGVRIEVLADNPITFSFYESGVASPGSLTLVAGNQDCRIYLSLRGRVRSTC